MRQGRVRGRRVGRGRVRIVRAVGVKGVRSVEGGENVENVCYREKLL